MEGFAQRAASRRRLQQIELELARLEKERDELQSELGEYKYPVLTLPSEIVSEILLRCLPPYPGLPALFGVESPTYLLGICHTWRKIALSTPWLWRSIYWEPVEGDTREYSEWAVELVQLWLDRSGSSPLSLFFDFNVPTLPKGGDELLQAVVAHCSRWEYANLGYLPRQASLISGSAPQLAELVVRNSWEGSFFSDAAAPGSAERLSFPDAALLRSLSAVNGRHNLDITTFPGRCTNLTSLYLSNVYPGECLPIVGAATNLQRCNLSLRLQNEWAVGSRANTSITLPRLEELALGTFEPGEWEPQFNVAGPLTDSFLDQAVWTLPALKRLQLQELENPLESVASTLKLFAFVKRFNSKLEHLRFVSMLGDPLESSNTSLAVTKLRTTFPDMRVDFHVPWTPLHDVELWVNDQYFSWEPSVMHEDRRDW